MISAREATRHERQAYEQSAGARLQLPIHLEAQVQNTLVAIANAKGIDLSVFVNDLLKKDIELIQLALIRQLKISR